MQFAGKRPPVGRCSRLGAPSVPHIEPSNVFPPLALSSPSPILLASILIAPVPYFSTQSATVSLRPVSASINGLRTTIIGSWAGFSAVPHPSHLRASSVAGAVMSNIGLNPVLPFTKDCAVEFSELFNAPLRLPTTSLSDPARLSNALLTSCDLGKPLK